MCSRPPTTHTCAKCSFKSYFNWSMMYMTLAVEASSSFAASLELSSIFQELQLLLFASSLASSPCDMKISYLLTFHRAQSTVTLRKALLVGQEGGGGADEVITLLALNREASTICQQQ